MLHSFNVTIIFVVFTASQQESEFNIFAKTGIGARVKFYGIGVESESRNSDSDHPCSSYVNIFSKFSLKKCCRFAFKPRSHTMKSQKVPQSLQEKRSLPLL